MKDYGAWVKESRLRGMIHMAQIEVIGMLTAGKYPMTGRL